MKTYKIIGFDKTSGVLTISFADNMAPIGIDVPLDDAGLYITGQELDTYVQGFIPTWHLERINKISAGIANESEIEALVEVLPTVEQTVTSEQQTQTDENIAMWTQLEQERQIAKILVKFGLLEQDPTQISTTSL